MSTTVIIVLVFLVLLVGFITVNYFRMKNAKPVANSKKIKVLNNKTFKTVTRRGVFLIDFWAPWCSPCKLIAPVLNEIAESETGFLVAKVNVDQNQNISKKYKVRNIPTLLILKDGVEAGRIVGVKPKKAILREVNKVIEG